MPGPNSCRSMRTSGRQSRITRPIVRASLDTRFRWSRLMSMPFDVLPRVRGATVRIGGRNDEHRPSREQLRDGRVGRQRERPDHLQARFPSGRLVAVLGAHQQQDGLLAGALARPGGRVSDPDEVHRRPSLGGAGGEHLHALGRAVHRGEEGDLFGPRRPARPVALLEAGARRRRSGRDDRGRRRSRTARARW